MNIKKLLFFLIVLTLLLSLFNCTGSGDKAELYVMPTAAVLPAEMPVERLLFVINTLLEGEDSVIFLKENADSFTVPVPGGGEERLYIFFIGDLEIGFFTDTEHDCLISAYVRSLLTDDDYTRLQMISFAGAILAAVEPNEYEKMLAEVLPADASGQDEKSAAGELWAIVYRMTIINIALADSAA